MLKHSSRDSFLVLLGLAQVFLLALPFFVVLTVPQLIGLSVLGMFLVGTNYQCVSHNFIHLPFFKSEALNGVFSCINSIGIAVPQSAYKVHHLNHHRHNNKPEFDESSTFRHGKDGKEENIIAYSLLGMFRTDITGLFKTAAKRSTLPYWELTTLALFLGVLLVLNWKLFLVYLLPTMFLGQVFALWENYCEHHYADPNDRKRDSVSCYNSLYNFVWFNNGYHQEHHFAPQVHWTQVPTVKDQLPEDRVVVKGCHLTNSF